VVGVEAAVVMPFTIELSKLSPQEFVQTILLETTRVRTVLVGENFRFGHKQAATPNFCANLAASTDSKWSPSPR